MVKVKKLGVILRPTKRTFENQAVLNPAIYQEGNTVHVLYRAVNKKFTSTIGYARLEGPTEVVERWEKPLYEPQYPYEKKGLEDPRLTKIKDTLYMTYTAHDGKNAVFCYSKGKHPLHLRKRGIISPEIPYDQVGKIFLKGDGLNDRYFMFEAYYEEFGGRDILLWEKDAVLFPKKIKGKFAMIHRILPEIQVFYFKDFNQAKSERYWREYLSELSKYVILEGRYWFESRNIGGGAPPIETKDGWLVIYHTVEDSSKKRKHRTYHAAAALLNKRNPTKLIGRLDYPLFSPEESWEKKGNVSNVVFPTGTAIFGKYLYIYYGAADKQIAAAKVNLKDLLKELKSRKLRRGE